MKRTPIAAVGRYGVRVNVYGIVLDGEPVARVEWREHGKRRTETFRGTKRDRENSARAFAEGVVERLRNGEAPAPQRRTVSELWRAYVNAHEPDWRPKTLKNAKARWRVFLLHVNPQTYADLVQPETLDDWRKVLLSKPTRRNVPMARNQVAHHIQLVKSVWRFARQRKMLRENVLADYAVRRGRDYQALEVPEFSPAEWAAQLSQLDYRNSRQWRAWTAIALDGLLAPRSNALLQLKWSDVDLGKRVVRWPGETDKLGRPREQPLPRDAVFVLRICKVWARRQEYTGPFIWYGVQQRSRHKAYTYSALIGQLHKAGSRAGIEHIKYRGMHSLRRMRGTDVLAQTGDITKVGDWLGDRDVRVLRKSYLRARPKDLARVAASATLPAANENGNETATAPKHRRRRKTQPVTE